MKDSQCVIGRACGRTDAPIMFIGEAPGRLGADASAIPFHGDRAGENFENFLEQVGLSRYDCFITNAVLCNPKDEKGNNSTPNRQELANCAQFLRRQIDLVGPKIIVTLGTQALSALRLISSHDIDLAGGVRKKWAWDGRILIPLYHPGQRALVHRSFLNQLADYRFVAETLAKLSKKKAPTPTPTSDAVSRLVRELLIVCGPVSYFALHKLFYLLEYEHVKHAKCRLTRSYIIRQKDGPYVVELNIKKLKKALPDLAVWNEGSKLMVGLTRNNDLFFSQRSEGVDANPVATLIFEQIKAKYAKKADVELKRLVYLTGPMREILRKEKYMRRDMFNAPIDFSIASR
jgi:uracil-DNA glycosylase family 4